MENMFKTDFNEPMIFSKVEMSVQHQKALSQMENSVKFMNGHYRLQLPWKHIWSKPLKQLWIWIGMIALLEEKIPVWPSPFQEL